MSEIFEEREGEQPLPLVRADENRNANDTAAVIWPKLRHRQTKKGLDKYGTKLQPWNRRNAFMDASMEFTDLGHYMAQMGIMMRDMAQWILDAEGRLAYPHNGSEAQLQAYEELYGRFLRMRPDLEQMVKDWDELTGAVR